MIWTHEHIFGSWSLKISNRRKFLFFVSFFTSIQCFLTDFDEEFFEVLVWWNFKVQRGWSSHDSTGGVVMGTVAWAEVTTSAHTDIGNWDASEMCADSEADQMKTVVKDTPINSLIQNWHQILCHTTVLLVLASFFIGLLISEGTWIDGVHGFNLFSNKTR